MKIDRPIILATRGSALALAQTNTVLATCRAAFPGVQFERKIIKTTGDKLQTAPPDAPGMSGTKGLFTKELEVALLNGQADLAVHSLKDLPTDLPAGLKLGAVLPRADVRDVLIYRGSSFPALPTQSRVAKEKAGIRDLPEGAIVATSSTRRQAQLLALRPDLKTIAIRGNVGTRLQKLADRADLDAMVLAAAGLKRLGFEIGENGSLGVAASSPEQGTVPKGLDATFLNVKEMVPCVGQGAIGIEGRAGDDLLVAVLEKLDDPHTHACVTAERAFLHALGGGCLSPVAAYADQLEGQLRIRAVSFRDTRVRRTERLGPIDEAAQLGRLAAADVQT